MENKISEQTHIIPKRKKRLITQDLIIDSINDSITIINDEICRIKDNKDKNNSKKVLQNLRKRLNTLKQDLNKILKKPRKRRSNIKSGILKPVRIYWLGCE